VGSQNALTRARSHCLRDVFARRHPPTRDTNHRYDSPFSRQTTRNQAIVWLGPACANVAYTDGARIERTRNVLLKGSIDCPPSRTLGVRSHYQGSCLWGVAAVAHTQNTTCILPSSSTHTRFDCTRRGPRTTLGKYFVWSQNGSNTADPFANGFEVSARTAHPTRTTTSSSLHIRA
jgi:hypothetical protein